MTEVHTHWPASRLVQNPVLRPAISPLHIASWTKGSSVDTVTGVSVFLSLMPLSGTTCTTRGFKRFYGNNRDARGIGLRLLHTLGGRPTHLGDGSRYCLGAGNQFVQRFFIEAGILGASFATTFCLTGSITACGSSLSAHQGVL